MDFRDPNALLRYVQSQGMRPDKDLGQHFLVDLESTQAIVNAATAGRSVLEIGPGPGFLTAHLDGRVAEGENLELRAIEVDPRMIKILAKSAPHAQVTLADALQTDLGALLRSMPAPRAIVSNLPYYITSPLLQRIADARDDFDVAVLMMQKEVASRLVAPPRTGERGSFSVYLQAIYDIAKVIDVPASAFAPPPKVDSTVLKMTPNPHPLASEELFQFVRLGFANPRKTLANVLAAGLKVPRESVLEGLGEIGLTATARAQELSLEEWSRLRDVLGKPVA